jgi:hypothetical protein
VKKVEVSRELTEAFVARETSLSELIMSSEKEWE